MKHSILDKTMNRLFQLIIKVYREDLQNVQQCTNRPFNH